MRIYSKHYGQSRQATVYSYRLSQLLLLLIYYAESKVDFIAFPVIRVDIKNIGEGLLRVVEGCISIIQQANTVPHIRVLGLARQRYTRKSRYIRHGAQSLLIRTISSWKLASHEETVAYVRTIVKADTKQCPDFARSGVVAVETTLKILDCLGCQCQESSGKPYRET